MIDRLSKKKNEGFSYFWFNEQEFTHSWFDKKNKDSIDILGGRYTPELNFELPIAKLFDGLSRGAEFKENIDLDFDKLLDKFRSVRFDKKEDFKKEFEKLNDLVQKFSAFYQAIKFNGIDPLPFSTISEKLDLISDAIPTLQNTVAERRIAEEKSNAGAKASYYQKPFANESHYLREFSYAVYEFYFTSWGCIFFVSCSAR